MQRFNLALAAQYANDPREIVSAAQARRQHSQELPTVQQAFVGAREAVTFARDRNIEREAVVDERSLLRDALRRATGEATLWDIRKNFESRIAKGEFIRVSEPGDDSLRRSFTTARMLAFEQDNIARMRSGQGLESPLVRSGTIRQSSAGVRSTQRVPAEGRSGGARKP